MYKKFNPFKYLLVVVSIVPNLLFAQHKSEGDSLLNDASLENVVQYALKHYPLIQQSQIDEEAARATIKSKLADWYPQISFVYNYQRNIQLQTLVTGLGTFRSGTYNTSSPQLIATQNLFNRDVLLAARTAGAVKENTRQTTESRKIDLTVNVTKAFYDVLATTQQIKVGQGDVNRLQQSLKTAKDQYNAGLTDKTDYKRATIALNNTLATLNSNEQLLKYKIEYLKSLMGYPVSSDLKIAYDTLQMENEIVMDTADHVNYKERIEYKLYQTQRYLQESNVKYQKWSYAPTVTAFGYYINYFFNNDFEKLYDKRYPNSYVGASLNWPIFQGGKRRANVRLQKLNLDRIDWDITNLEKTVNSQYNQALSAYKANLVTYLTLKENMALAKEVYDVIQLQYKSGVKTYLEVITAETDLRTARINYFNSLYGVLASKVDLQKALGEINY
jgi:outer membrane protein